MLESTVEYESEYHDSKISIKIPCKNDAELNFTALVIASFLILSITAILTFLHLLLSARACCFKRIHWRKELNAWVSIGVVTALV